MKNFKRKDLSFSLCGLNCELCPMKLGKHCPGCGGGTGNQSCSIAKCSLQRENIQYCFQCADYPCEKYHDINLFDSFITHQNQKSDMDKFRVLGAESYLAEQQRKKVLLSYLLDNYNDGRKKTLFCVAVNLLDLDDIERIIQKLDADSFHLTLKERASYAAGLFHETAARKNILLKLRKKK